MKLPRWYKVSVGLRACLLIGIAIVIFFDCYSQWNQKEAVEDYEERQEAEAIVIDVPEPCTEGYLTVFDSEGVAHFQYSGSISIENDGKNGRPIEIYVYVSPEDTAYNLP